MVCRGFNSFYFLPFCVDFDETNTLVSVILVVRSTVPSPLIGIIIQ